MFGSDSRDALLAAALTALGVATLLAQPLAPADGVTREADLLGIALSVAMTAPLAWRRRAPLASLAVAGVCAVVASTTGYALTVGTLVVWMTVGSAALHTDARTARGLVALGALAVAGTVMIFSPESRTLLGVLAAAAVGTLPPLVGDALRRQRELLTEVQALQAGDVHRARTQARLEVVRDIHDIVGHHLSAITLQAGAARMTTGTEHAEPPEVVFARIAGLGERALADTRASLGLLDAAASTRPTPALHDLDELLEGARLAGVQILGARVTCLVDALPEPTQAAAYRIIQEALTNVARHASPATAEVTLESLDGMLRVEVIDHGVRAPARVEGRGIAGMRERATLLGGRLTAGPTARGGWSVCAELPR